MKLIINETNETEAAPTPRRMTQAALHAIRREPGLGRCRVDSLLAALTVCTEAGLLPDGRHAHLVPCGKEMQVILDWRGMAALGRRCGVEAIHADVVCEGDDFGVNYDGGARLTHTIDYHAGKEERGAVYAAYCYYIVEGEPDVEVMTREEVERFREEDLAPPGHNPDNSGDNSWDNSALAAFWEKDWEGMAKRAVMTRAALRWPLDECAESLFHPDKPCGDPGGGDDTNFGGGVAEGITHSRTVDTAECGQRPSCVGHCGPHEHGDATPPWEGEEIPEPIAGSIDEEVPQARNVPQAPKAPPLEALRYFMHARKISDAAMLDYLKEEGRIADYIADLADVPEPVIEGVVDAWVDMMEEGEF